jgi:tRNA A37 threonylcarbamoyladenosine synthetase subunit TsaC/SUA5/YrdC
MEAFSPGPKTVNINVSSSSQSVQVTAHRGKAQVRIMNNGSATAWIAFGDSTVTASASSGIPVGPGVTEVMTVGDSASIYVAAIAAASTGNIYFTPGAGV